MATYRTSEKRKVGHWHDPELSAAEIEQSREYMENRFPDVEEIRPPSAKYNCHGYALAKAHGFFEAPEFFIEDDLTRVPMNAAKRGDVLVYRKSGKIRHTAIVRTVANGKIKKLRSKWGDLAAVIHKPREVHWSYGKPHRLMRRNSQS